MGHGRLLPEQLDRRHVHFCNNPTALDGTNPGATGDPFASFLLGIPTGGTYQSSGWTYAGTSYQAYFLDDSWQVNPKLTFNLGFRLENPGAFTEKDDRIVVFDRDVVNPVLAGRTNPVTGQPFLGAFELVNSDEQPERGLRKQVFRRAVPRGGFAYQLGENTVLRGGAGTFVTPSTVRFQDGVNGPVIQRTNTIVTSVDNNRTFFTDMSNPFPTGVENFPGRDESFQRVLLGGTARRFYLTKRDTRATPTSGTSRCSISSGTTCRWNSPIAVWTGIICPTRSPTTSWGESISIGPQTIRPSAV